MIQRNFAPHNFIKSKAFEPMKNRIKTMTTLSILACLCALGANNAECGIRIGDYLATADNDYTLDFPNKKITVLNASSSNTPILNEVELRVDIDELENDEQRYAIRFKLNGWGEARDGQRVYEATLSHGETERALLYNRALKERYTTVINYLYNKHVTALNEQLMVLYEDRVNVLRQMAASPDFDANDLMDVENDIIRLQLDLINLKNDAVTIEDEIERNAPVGPVEFDSEIIAGIDAIEIMADRIRHESVAENVYLEEARLNAELAEARHRLEQSENRKYLRFIEAAYDMGDREDFEKAFSVQFGIAIPIVNPNRLDANRGKLASLKARNKYENARKSAAGEIVFLARNLKRLIRQYAVLADRKTESGTESSYRIYRHIDGISPLILLKFKESMLKTDIAIEKTRRRIYQKYIKLLDISGRLSQKPTKNYLSAN